MSALSDTIRVLRYADLGMSSNLQQQGRIPGLNRPVEETRKIANNLLQEGGNCRVEDYFRRYFPSSSFWRSATPVETLLSPQGRLLWTDATGSLTLWIHDRGLPGHRLVFLDFVAVDFDVGLVSLVEHHAAKATPSTRDHFLMDQVLPRLLSTREGIVLHAGAVRVDTRCIAFVGSSGAGKSTITASFGVSGFEILGDDAQIIRLSESGAFVSAVYPSLRVLPDTWDALLLNSENKKVAQYSEKVLVNFPQRTGESFDPLSAVFVIDPIPTDHKIEIRRLKDAEACMSTLENSFALNPTDNLMAADRLRFAASVVARTPFFGIRYPRNYGRLHAVREEILRVLEQTRDGAGTL